MGIGVYSRGKEEIASMRRRIITVVVVVDFLLVNHSLISTTDKKEGV